jgi:hypothetical protein
MKPARIAATAALAIAATVFSAGAASAAPPSNDTVAGATTVSGLPFHDQVDTTEATSDAEDDAIAAQCTGVPAWDATVWYSYTSAASGAVVADASASSYSTGIFVVTGTPGNWSLVGCAPSAVGWETTAGVTYHVIAFDDQSDGSGNGGMLDIIFDAIPPPPTIDITVQGTGTFNKKTGAATVSGTVTCSSDAEFAFLEVQLSQDAGRLIIRGSGGTNVTCDGATRPWSVMVVSDYGRFAAGKALSLTVGVACGRYLCGDDFEERTIRLRNK